MFHTSELRRINSRLNRTFRPEKEIRGRFEDKEKFNRWMVAPNKALGGKAPFDIINSQFGREEVKNILGRIEYGVYS
jgi:putative toxin-antitoxin system antitoxin component (TIGR02293 family)